MPDEILSVLDGSTFVIGDRHGDVRAHEGRIHGFFSDDTRFLSRWVLNVADTPLVLLGLEQSAHFAAQFFLTPSLAPHEEAPCSIIRRRLVDQVWIEEITVANHLHESNQVHVAIEVDTDFADLFEVKDGDVADRDITCDHDQSTLTLGYERAGFGRSITISSSCPARITRHGFAYSPTLAPGEQWSVTLTAIPHAVQPGTSFIQRAPRGAIDTIRASKTAELEGWLARTPTLQTDSAALLARIAQASPTSARCACTRTSTSVRRCRPQGCRGSWHCSAATA